MTEEGKTEGTKFDPAQHMKKLQGKDYLEVWARVLWANLDNDQLSILTELVELRIGDEPRPTDLAIFKAEVITPKGAFVAYGSETRKDFPDFIEKANTKATGRAMALAGYGTQFAEDWVFDPNDVGKVVDSPVEKRQAPPAQPQTQPAAPASTQPSNATSVPKAISEKQIALIRDRMDKKGDAGKTIVSDFLKKNGVTRETMNSRQASELINLLAEAA